MHTVCSNNVDLLVQRKKLMPGTIKRFILQKLLNIILQVDFAFSPKSHVFQA